MEVVRERRPLTCVLFFAFAGYVVWYETDGMLHQPPAVRVVMWMAAATPIYSGFSLILARIIGSERKSRLERHHHEAMEQRERQHRETIELLARMLEKRESADVLPTTCAPPARTGA
jgi:uncharacterized protein involved in response to NO